LAAALVAFAPVVGLAGAQGGFFPGSWGWASFPLLWIVALALALRSRIRLTGAERLFLVCLLGLAMWVLLSAIWSVAPAESILESQRALLYVAALAAALLVTRSSHVPQLLGGLLAAICAIAAFALATRVLPDRVGVFDSTSVYRLAQPIGYWNGLAVFCGMGALVATAFAARHHSIIVRGVCSAAIVLLFPTFYFTFGRGGWIALLGGLVAAVAVDPKRLQFLAALLVLAPLPVVAVWIASRENGLTNARAALSEAVHDGHRYALLLLLLGVINAALAVAFTSVERRLEPPVVLQRVFGFGIVFVVVVGVAIVFVRYGGPTTLAQKGYDAFKAPPPHVEDSLNKRLLSFSGNGRADLWRLAWDEAQDNPVFGAGAGTYERYFLAHQPSGIGRVRDAHGLYIETLAELGPVGLIVLLAALVTPLTVLGSARRHPLVPGALGAYVAYLVHTGVDWDWELPAVTLTGLLCGAVVLIAARRSLHSPRLSSRTRWVTIGLVALAAAYSAIALIGNTSLSQSDSARRNQDWARAATDARRAKALMPWSPKPWEALGRVQLAAGLPAAAQRSFRKAISIDPGDWELWYRLAAATRGAERQSALRGAAKLFPQAHLLRRAAEDTGS
jgi:hypothetical protein